MAWLYCPTKKEITVCDFYLDGESWENKVPGVTLLKLKAKVFDMMSRAVEICNSFHLLPLVHEKSTLVPAARAWNWEEKSWQWFCVLCCLGGCKWATSLLSFLAHLPWFAWQAKLRGCVLHALGLRRLSLHCQYWNPKNWYPFTKFLLPSV